MRRTEREGWQQIALQRKLIQGLVLGWLLLSALRLGLVSSGNLLPDVLLAAAFVVRLAVICILFLWGIWGSFVYFWRGGVGQLWFLLLVTPLVFTATWISTPALAFSIDLLWIAAIYIECICPPGAFHQAAWGLWLHIRSQGVDDSL